MARKRSARAPAQSKPRSHAPPVTAGGGSIAWLDRPWAPALVLAVLCLIFVGAVHGFDGTELAKGYDWAEQFSFQRDFLTEAAERRELPLWCPYTFGGRPFYADPQTMVFYPATALWLFLPKMAAFTLDVLLHYFLAAFFAFLFVRSIGARPIFALLAGGLYSFSGFNLHHITAGHINFHASVAWLPLVFWCVEKAIQGRWAFWLLAAGALGVQFLAGSIPVSWMTFLFSGLYAFVRLSVPFDRRRALRGVTGLMAMFVLGVGISSVQLLPTAEFASLGVRSAASYEYSTYLDLPPRNLVNLLFPQGKIDGPNVPEASKLIPEGEYNGYIGILALGLGLCGMTLWRRAAAPALAAMTLLALPLMLGDATPLFRLLWLAVPGVSRLRFHCREILIFSFAMVSAAALALEEFARAPRDRKLDLSLWIGGGVLALAGVAAIAYLAGNPTAPPWQIAFIVLGVAGLWLSRRNGAAPAVAAGLAAFAFFDVTINATRFDTYYAQIRAGPPAMESQLSSVMKQDGGLFRAFFHKRAYTRERFITDRHSGVDGYEAMIPRRYYEFIHAMCDTPIKDYLVAEATQEMFSRRSAPFPFRVLNLKYTTVAQPDRSYELLVDPDPDPRAYLALEAAVVADDAAAIALLKTPGFDPRHTAILDSAPPAEVRRAPAPPLPAPPSVPAGARTLSADGRVSTTEAGRCEIVTWGLNAVRIRTRAPQPTVLVLSEGWFPGWTATVDGGEAPIHRAAVTLRAVAVPAGDHEVVFRFKPRPLRVGGAVSLISILATVAAIAVVTRRERGIRRSS